MSRHSYCSSCGAHNPYGVKSCTVCASEMQPPSQVRNNPVSSKSFANQKLALFDIDETILDTKERFRAGRRAGVVDKDGGPVRKGLKSGWKERDGFLYQDDMLLKDRIIPNAMNLISHLTQQGYVIAYCTARPFPHYESTKRQLEAKGFPLFNAANGDTLLFLKRNRGQNKGAYKAEVVQSLQAQYDVTLAFDDDVDVLAAIAKTGVPGLYPSVKLYWEMVGAKSNPAWGPQAHMGRDGQYVTGTKNIETAYRAMIDPDDPQGRTIGETSYKGDLEDGQSTLDDFVKSNPAKRGTDSKGSYYRWGGGKKYYYKAGNKTSREKARKAAYGQARAAFASGYDGKMTGAQYRAGVKQMLQARKNPSNPAKVEKAKKLYKHMNQTEPDKVEKKTVDIGDVWYQVGEGGCWQIGYMSGKETGSSSQKYIHHFNEETKDGNFPKLYASLPDKGKPMLIITGGTWKIKTDENGVAWIYD